MKEIQNKNEYEGYNFEFVATLLIVLWFLLNQRLFKNILPIVPTKEKPKLEYDAWSGVFYWDDEGVDVFYGKKLNVLKCLFLYRTFLLENGNQRPLNVRLKIYKWIFYQIKIRNPNWIGFQESRCSYNPQVANRIKRIRKVAYWRIEKMFNEEDEYNERISE